MNSRVAKCVCLYHTWFLFCFFRNVLQIQSPLLQGHGMEELANVRQVPAVSIQLMEDGGGECSGEGQGRFCIVNVRRTLLCSPVFKRTIDPVGLRQLKIFMSDITV